jgi:hypothetical protein
MPKGYPMPQQIDDVITGDRLEFIRPVTVEGVRLAAGNGKRVDAIASYGDLSLVAFKKPLRDTSNNPVAMLKMMGFKHCYLVPKSVLIANCKRV